MKINLNTQNIKYPNESEVMNGEKH